MKKILSRIGNLIPNARQNTDTKRTVIPKNDQMRSFWDEMSEFVREEWLDDEEIEKILSHPIVESSSNNRKAATTRKELQIQCDDENILDELKKILDGDFIDQVLDTPYQGMGAWELNWYEKHDLYFPHPVERDYRAFVWREGKLQYAAMGMPVPIPPFKIVTAFHRRKFNKPYGTALLKKLFWPVKFSTSGIDFWLKFLEKYGVPWVIGKTDGEKDDMADELYAMLSGDSAVVDPDDDVKVITATHNGDHDKLVEKCDNYIREIILGGNLTGEVKSGSLAAAQVHGDVREDIALADKRIVHRVFAQIIDNFKTINNLEIDIDVELADEDDPKTEFAERDHKLYEMGYQRTKEEVEEFYGIKVNPVAKQDTAYPAKRDPGKLLSFSATGATDELQRQTSAVDTKALEEEIVTVVESALSQAETFEEALAILEEMLPTLSTPALEEMLSGFVANGEILGRAEVEGETGDE